MTEQKIIADMDIELNQILSEINAINNDNLEKKLKKANYYIKQLEIKKKFLKKTASEKEYYYICDKLHKGIKQISPKLDSIIEMKKEEQKRISSELSKTVNKKKLINYQR